MKQITITVPDNKYKFTLELLRYLKFIRIVSTQEQSVKGKNLKVSTAKVPSTINKNSIF